MAPMNKLIDFSSPPPAPTIEGMYSTSDVAGIFGGISRQMVFHIAHKEGWAAVKKHRHQTLYRAEDVLRYWEARRRTEMLYRIGLTAKGLLREPRENEEDIACPTCGAYAYSTESGFACVNNHRKVRHKKAGNASSTTPKDAPE